MRLRDGEDKGGILSMIGSTAGGADSGGGSIKAKSIVGVKVGVWVINFGF